MKTIKELIKSKPSIALQGMVDGLLKQSKRKGFKINMNTYGVDDFKICYGCAATCTVQQITKHNFKPGEIWLRSHRSQALNVEFDDLYAFEHAVNEARFGDMTKLFVYCDALGFYLSNFGWIDYQFQLMDENWQEQLPAVRRVIKELKKNGL